MNHFETSCMYYTCTLGRIIIRVVRSPRFKSRWLSLFIRTSSTSGFFSIYNRTPTVHRARSHVVGGTFLAGRFGCVAVFRGTKRPNSFGGEKGRRPNHSPVQAVRCRARRDNHWQSQVHGQDQ